MRWIAGTVGVRARTSSAIILRVASGAWRRRLDRDPILDDVVARGRHRRTAITADFDRTEATPAIRLQIAMKSRASAVRLPRS